MSFTRKTMADAIDAYDADIDLLQQSKRETFADYREQLAEEGRDKDAVKGEIAAFKAAMKRRRAVAKEGNEAVEDQAELVDEIFVEITAARAPRATRVENIEEFPAEDPEVTTQKARLAALRADPAMSIVSADNLKSEPRPDGAAQTELVRTSAPSPVESEAVVISTPIQPETAYAGEAQKVERRSPKPEDTGSIPVTHAKYAEAGVITWERTPPEGVRRHEFSQAFGDAGQDSAVIEDDLANAASAPIVKIGNEILDGWARYMTARNMDIEYPVVQYEGSDPLIDCIRWNFQGRMLNSEQTFRIAQKLTKLNPKRKADIYAAMELGMELVS